MRLLSGNELEEERKLCNMKFKGGEDAEYEYYIKKQFRPFKMRYVVSEGDYELLKIKRSKPIQNLTLSTPYHPKLQECYNILLDDVIIDTSFEVFKGVFVRNAYKGKITFNKGMTAADIHYLFKGKGFFDNLVDDKNKWGRLAKCIEREDGKIFSKKSLDTPNNIARAVIEPILNKAKDALAINLTS